MKGLDTDKLKKTMEEKTLKLTRQELCKPAIKAGVQMETYGKDISHIVHSLTVEDVRDFFDESFPVQNNIPTINFTSNEILPSAQSYPSSFKLPLARAFDVLLQNDDDPEAFLSDWPHFGSDLSTIHLQKFGHLIHMMEIWNDAATEYRSITKKNIDVQEVCPCIVDEQENGILENMMYNEIVRAKTTHKMLEKAERYGSEPL